MRYIPIICAAILISLSGAALMLEGVEAAGQALNDKINAATATEAVETDDIGLAVAK